LKSSISRKRPGMPFSTPSWLCPRSGTRSEDGCSPSLFFY
jgi:hypothetical protein